MASEMEKVLSYSGVPRHERDEITEAILVKNRKVFFTMLRYFVVDIIEAESVRPQSGCKTDRDSARYAKSDPQSRQKEFFNYFFTRPTAVLSKRMTRPKELGKRAYERYWLRSSIPLLKHFAAGRNVTLAFDTVPNYNRALHKAVKDDGRRAEMGLQNSGMEEEQISRAFLHLLNEDNSVPAHVKVILVYLIDNLKKKDRELAVLKDREIQLFNENSLLKQKLSSVKANPSHNSRENAVQVTSFVSTSPNFEPRTPCSPVEYERRRSCSPLSIHRLGYASARSPRLLKVVLPASKFQVQLLQSAPRLRFFPIKGVFVRPSLTREERVKLRQSRNHSTSSK
ncbi:hypothetical protein OSTOST_19455 [Ostertagia ostertagi]